MGTPALSSDLYKDQIRNIINGENTLTVGANGGRFATVAAAVAYINTQSRYTVVYNTGTVDLTNGDKSVVPSGGADFTGINTTESRELWLYLDAVGNGMMLPLLGVSPHIVTTTWGDFGDLKYDYEGATGAKSYELVKPNWYHIQLLAGEVVDPVHIAWPLFTSMSGVSKEASTFRGSIGVAVQEPGIWMRDFNWGSIHDVWFATEEALISIHDDSATEEGYAQIVMENVSGGRGNYERDVTFRVVNSLVKLSHALFQSINCDYYGSYDVVQCSSRNVIFKHNNVDIRCQVNDAIVHFAPAGFRWFSGNIAPETDLFIDLCNNNFNIYTEYDAAITYVVLLIADDVSYLTGTPPDVYGQVLDNQINATSVSADKVVGISSPGLLFSASLGRVLIDRNTFNVSGAGAALDIEAHATATFLVLGKNNVTKSGAALSIGGAPLRLENHGLSAAIATGATIAHGLGAVPTTVSVTPTGAKTDVYATVDATNITVNYGGGGTSTFHWKVEL